MAVGAGFDYFSASVIRARLGGLGAKGRDLCSSATVVVKLRVGSVSVICGLAVFGGSGRFDSFGLGPGAVGHSRCPFACALVSGPSWFARLLPAGVRRVVRWRCLMGLWVVSGSLRGAMLGGVVGPGRVSGDSAGRWGPCLWPVWCLGRGQALSGRVWAAAARGALGLGGGFFRSPWSGLLGVAACN